MIRVAAAPFALMLLAACNGGTPAESAGMGSEASGTDDAANAATGASAPEPSGSADESDGGSAGASSHGSVDEGGGGCVGPEDCGPGETCDGQTGLCVCDENHRRCDGICVPLHDAEIDLGEIEVVETSPELSGIAAMEIAPSGQPLIAYAHYNGDEDLWIAERGEAGWSTQVAYSPSYSRVDDAAVDFGPDGVPIVKVATFSDGESRWYAGSPLDGAWAFTYELARSPSGSSRVDLGRGGDGVLYTLYARSMSPSPALQVWVEPDLGPALPIDPELSFSNLVVDGAGVPHLAYELPGAGVYHTTMSDGAWVDDLIELIPHNNGIGALNLARTPDDAIVANFVRSDGEHVIATLNDGSWEFEITDQLEVFGVATLRIDGTGARHLWYRGEGFSVAYARHDGVQWHSHDLGDNLDAVPWYLSVDDDGSAAHVVSEESPGLPEETQLLYRRISITPTCG